MINNKLLDSNYSEFLKGKSVALVGPAKYLTDLELGEIIDSHDVVVRINRGTELIEKFGSNIGRKTDVLYNCLIKSPDNGGDLSIKRYKENGIKWVSTIPGSDPTGVCTSQKLHKMVSFFDVLKLKYSFNFHVMNHVSYSKVNENVKSRSNTGYAAIFDILDHGVSKLFITGFSFYLDDFAPGYKDGCDRDAAEFARQCFVSKRHNQKFQWEYLKEFKEKDSRIETDPVLDVILRLDNLDRDEFQEKVKGIL